MKTLKDFKRELLADPAARAEYEAQSAEFSMTRELIRGIVEQHLSPAQRAAAQASARN